MNHENRKVLFVHDGPLFFDDKGDFYGLHFNDDLKRRYLHLGSEVTFLMRTKPIEKNDIQRYSSINQESFSVTSIPNYKSLRLLLKNYGQAKKIIERAVLEHDVIVCRLPSASGSLAVKMARKLGKPFLVEYVACTFDAYWNYDWRGKLIAHYKMWQQRSLMKNVPYSIYVTSEFLQKRYPTKGQSIHCSNVELQTLKEADLVERISKIEAMEPSNPVVLGTVAALNVPYKGQVDVIKALAVLKRNGHRFHYHLVGQGSSERLVNLAKKLNVVDQVKVVGPLKHKEVFEFLENIDIYIQPSKTEGLPRAVIEAMSKACPALGAGVGGIPELLDNNMIFEPGKSDQIAKKIVSFNKTNLIEQARRNYEEAKNYKKDILMDRRLNLYEVFLKNNF